MLLHLFLDLSTAKTTETPNYKKKIYKKQNIKETTNKK